ncbi:hypothetical protein BO71DRAFT_405359 [Aspergillus ellipticus CBS 707.79]|uniref:Uncharacterized protein n=1 Tax=Aspergillus ellipticus CBS 707.79 TaxID=1448320 RepID=A0A319DZ04_9EURO|nr:hypothetical protein BO71DRAFT_405359 [Aspergillus ellipticus CBS 707.79]
MPDLYSYLLFTLFPKFLSSRFILLFYIYPGTIIRPTINPKEAITTELNKSLPVLPERISGVNGLVCDIAVNRMQMCVENLSKVNTGFEEKITGKNALKHWVLYLSWRQARYLYELKNKILYELLIWCYTDVCKMLQDAISAPKYKNAASATSKKPKNAAPAKIRSSSYRGRVYGEHYLFRSLIYSYIPARLQ